MRGGSKFTRTARNVILNCLFGDAIELPSLDICLELTIPGTRIKFSKPFTKRGEFRYRELTNLSLDLLHSAHRMPFVLYPCPRKLRLAQVWTSRQDRRSLDADPPTCLFEPVLPLHRKLPTLAAQHIQRHLGGEEADAGAVADELAMHHAASASVGQADVNSADRRFFSA
jgi:hypothetical protein